MGQFLSDHEHTWLDASTFIVKWKWIVAENTFELYWDKDKKCKSVLRNDSICIQIMQSLALHFKPSTMAFLKDVFC